ncbi:peptidylprolyl isomerase [candidate division KSB1 bacterium]|nr:peptidylprolyl isomerase [candidate division KSB1 bacterium]
MNRVIKIIFLSQLLLACTAWPQVKAAKKYVAENDVRLLAHAIGKPIAALAKGTECTVVREQGEMIQVQITGWISRSSLLETAPLRALHILVDSREEADAIYAQLRAGKSFEELARAHSKSPTAERGGDIGYFEKGDFDVKIETVIISLKNNEISPIVEFGGKYNIFKRIE